MIYLVIGRRKKGKTTIARHLSLKTEQRVSIDPRGLLPRDSTIVVTSGTGVRGALLHHTPDVTLVPRRDTQQDYEVAIDAVADYVEREQPRSLTVLIDETRFIPDLLTGGLDWILRCADPDCVNVIMTCHRPVDIKTDIRAIADHWLLFHMTQEHDLKVVEEKGGIKARNLVTRLPDRHFVDWNDAEGVITVYSDPSAWYTPLRSTGEPRNAPELIGGVTAVDPEPELF